jgi:signal transduction histidine kinase
MKPSVPVEKLSCRADRQASLGRLAANMSHNVNNPLTYVLNYIFILKETVKDEKAQAVLKKMEQGVNKAKATLQELVDLSRPPKDPVEDLRLKPVIAEAIDEFADKKGRGRTKIREAIDEHLKVRAPRLGLRLVVSALLENAAEAGAAEVRLEGRRQGGMAVLTVCDDGSGMEKEDLTRLFEPFFSTRTGGRGLSLYMSYNILRSFGADVWCSSEPGRGTEFNIILPVAP